MLPISLKIPNISFDQAETVHGGYYIRKQNFRQFFGENLRRNVIYWNMDVSQKYLPLKIFVSIISCTTLYWGKNTHYRSLKNKFLFQVITIRLVDSCLNSKENYFIFQISLDVTHLVKGTQYFVWTAKNSPWRLLHQKTKFSAIFQGKSSPKCYLLKYGRRSKIFPVENFRFHHFVYYSIKLG